MWSHLKCMTMQIKETINAAGSIHSPFLWVSDYTPYFSAKSPAPPPLIPTLSFVFYFTGNWNQSIKKTFTDSTISLTHLADSTLHLPTYYNGKTTLAPSPKSTSQRAHWIPAPVTYSQTWWNSLLLKSIIFCSLLDIFLQHTTRYYMVT